ncbi:MAG: TldD/PmbA family protein [Nitrospirota bacterium]
MNDMDIHDKTILNAADDAAAVLRQKGVNSFDVYVRWSSSISAEAKDQKLDAYEQARSWGAGIRALLPDGRLGFSFASGSPEAVREAASMAVQNARNSEPDYYNNIPIPSPEAFPEITEYDEEVAKVSADEAIARAIELERAALDHDGRIARVRKASVSMTSATWAILNSEGLKARSRGTWLSCGIMAVAEEAGDSQMGYGFDYSRRLSGIDYKSAGAEASEKAISLLKARKAPTGKFPAILENEVAAEFLGVLASSFSGESLVKGRSLLAGKTGEKIFSDRLNICDNGTLPGGLSTRPFDDEGIASRRNILVQGGVFNGFLHNSYTAKRTGGTSTGNAVRGGFRSAPGVGPANLYIENGLLSKDGLISRIDKGLFIREVLGMHTANPISGDFSVGVAGLWIENGRIAYPIREGAIAGNLISIFSGIDAVGSDLRFVGKLGAPSLLLKPISVSGS